jgi:hypothetical protein
MFPDCCEPIISTHPRRRQIAGGPTWLAAAGAQDATTPCSSTSLSTYWRAVHALP